MARITRKTQKIFASAATNNGQFGSAQAGTKITTSDPDVIQALPAYANGWNSATISAQRLQCLEEVQALDFMETYQLSYLFQEGIPEYDVGTTYFQNSIVKKPGTYQIYGSIVDNNVGNVITDVTKWRYLTDLSATTSFQTLTTVASAATVDLGAITTHNALMTGVASISSFGSSADIADPVYIVVSNGAHTLVNSSTMKLLGGANITCAAGDVYMMQYLGGSTWQMMSFNKADGTPLVSPQGVPAGVEHSFAGSAAPAGYLLEYGQAVSRTTYAALFAVIGTTYGIGDGTTTFNLPDMRGYVPVGKDDMGGTAAGRVTSAVCGIDGTVLGASGGDQRTQQHTHTATQAAHAHTVPVGTGSGFSASGGGILYATTSSTATSSAQPAITVSNYGNGTAQNMQPSTIRNYIIKY